MRYCNKDCQKQHWTKGEHRKHCTPVSSLKDRKPKIVAAKSETVEGDECAICLELLTMKPVYVLPCSHPYHISCVEKLRHFGVKQVCPLCRADLPPGAERISEEAACRYYALDRHIHGRWDKLTKKEAVEMGEIVLLYREAASQGFDDAKFYLGEIYLQGRGVIQSDSMAAEMFRDAANNGHARAACNLGNMCREGRGVKQSYASAFHWTKKAAVRNNATAQCNLGIMYSQGTGAQQSNSDAVQWYAKAAAQGLAKAQWGLGNALRDGLGVDRDDAKATKCFRDAADQGHPEAQGGLGDMYRFGRGVAQSSDKAVHWYRKAAVQGHSYSISQLAQRLTGAWA